MLLLKPLRARAKHLPSYEGIFYEGNTYAQPDKDNIPTITNAGETFHSEGRQQPRCLSADYRGCRPILSVSHLADVASMGYRVVELQFVPDGL